MSFGDHLEELRRRVLISLVAMVLSLLVCFGFHAQLKRFFRIPFDNVRESILESTRDEVGGPVDIGKLALIGPLDGFMTSVKVAFLASFVVGGPVMLWQLWQFVAAGLYRSERRAVLFYFPLGLLMFFLGLAFGFFGILPYGLEFLVSWDLESEITMRWTYYLNFVLLVTLVTGLIFQIPLIMLFLSRTGLVAPSTFSSKRRICIFMAFVLGAFLTPPDPITQILMASSMIVLFEFGLVLSRLGWRKRGEVAQAFRDLTRRDEDSGPSP